MLGRKSFTPRLWKLTIPLATTPLLLTLLVMLFHGAASAQGAPLAAESIPLVAAAPKLDADCTAAEYGGALAVNFVDAGPFNATVFLQHDGANLYVCMVGAGSLPAFSPSAAVYLDTDKGQESQAEADDLGLAVGFVVGASGPITSTRGDGAGGYTVDPTLTGWDAQSKTTPNIDTAEWQIPIELISLELCSNNFGISVFHHDVKDFGDDHGWPAGAVPNSPKTWAEATLAGLDCSDLSVTKVDSEDPVPIGVQFTYTIEVTNNSKTPATNVVVTDTLPAGIVYVGHAAPGGVVCAEASGVVTCTIPSIPASGKVVIQIFVRGTATGAVSNKVVVAIPGVGDVTPGDNRDEERTTIEGLSGKLAYVFRLDDVTANDFKTLLESRGFTVQLIPLPTVLATDFSVFDAILIADDTGDLREWPQGTPGVSAEADHINGYNKPTIGLGEGGYAYFGKQGKSIGWPNGWHGPQDKVTGINPGMTYWQIPTAFAIPGVVQIYTNPVNEVGIYFPPLADVVPLGVEPAAADHAPLIADKQDCDQLFGFSGGPPAMTADGKNVVVNAVVFALGRRCTPPPPPTADECVELIKTAAPPDGAPVQPGDAITYTVQYKVKDTENCRVFEAVLEDPVPANTIFVPGSATDGIAPGGDGVLRWPLGTLNPGATGNKQFSVYVTHAACRQQRVRNQARLTGSLGVFTSNVVQHPVECPPVIPDDPGNPPYAESEVRIYPYPLVTDQPTDVSVRVHNLLNTTQTVTVSFQTSPQNFGIGIDFATVPIPGNPRVVTLPPLGTVEVKWQWTPTTSGHYCVSIKIESAGHAPIHTARNLDVQEDLRPGVTDVLSFTVKNPKPVTATIQLVVDNTCPGWVASVNPPLLTDMAPGEMREAALSVTPPNAPLGTACHIDVQGWIGSELIGGIRKLDVPPVHLPPGDPPWLEQEIVAIPDPPVAGQLGQICVQLNNPLPIPRTVSIQFSEADFGAGIPFTPIGGLPNQNIPASSFQSYCIPWTPATGGTTHRCILVTLTQAGFHDQHSQRNIDIRRLTIGSLDELLDLEIPFTIGNTAQFTRPLRLDPVVIGLWPIVPQITPDPPPTLGPGQQIKLTLGLLLPAAAAAEGNALQATSDDPLTVYGDVARIDVAAYLDGEQVGGVSVEFDLPPEAQLYLPAVNGRN